MSHLLAVSLLGALLATGACGGGGGSDPLVLEIASTPAREGQANSVGGVLAANAIIIGDGAVNQTVVGFVSFDLTALPAGATVVGATLRISQFLGFGAPYTDLGDLLLDHVDLGTDLDATDLSNPALQSGVGVVFTTPAPGTAEVDVTSSVLDDLAAARTRTEFRLRFPLSTDLDSVQDTTQVGGESANDPSQPPLRLVVRYEP